MGVSNSGDKGRLPTMAEFFLLGKSHVIVELDDYLSTFSYFAALLGNGTVLTLPYDIPADQLDKCTRMKPAQKGTWRRGDKRASSNRYFMIK